MSLKLLVSRWMVAAVVAVTGTVALADATVIWVDCNSTGASAPYATKGTAATTIAAAMAAADGAGPYEIRVCAGTYTESGFELNKAISVIGDTGDSKDVEIVDNTAGQRAFTLTHADALVANLTVSGQGLRAVRGQGGHIRMSDGKVENCVIKDGRASPTKSLGYGGNIYMTGGKLYRCLVTGGMCNWGGWPGAGMYYSYGMALYATGGTIDSCLFKDNKVTEANTASRHGVYLKGPVYFLNSIVTGGSSVSSNTGAGIQVSDSSARVVNSVFYGNGDGSANSNFGDTNLGKFYNCASSVTNSSCATWRVLTEEDFVDYRGGNLRPSVGSQLVDAGTMDVAYRPTGNSEYDLDGKDRVAGETIDIGCWELDQSVFAYGGMLDRYSALVSSNVTFIAFTVGPASDIVYEWDHGNGTISQTSNAAFTYAYPRAGLFTVRLRASADGGSTWGEWKTLIRKIVIAPETMWLDSANANPVFPYATKETAATSFAAVMGALTNNISADASCVDGVTLMIAAGSHPGGGMRISSAIRALGETGDPKDVEIVDNTAGLRAFTLKHEGARVADLTISGSGLQTNAGQGGHIWMSAGTVENCIIQDGRASSNCGYGYGGNVYMTGGNLVRCQVLRGKCNWGGWNGNYESHGMAVYATGGLIDGCFFKDNKVTDNNSRSFYGVFVNGVVTVANCTVTGGASYREKKGVGIKVNNASATIVNCVFYGNGDDSANANFGDSNLGRFFNCASSVTNGSCATWKVLIDDDFVDYLGGDLRPNVLSSLVDAGTSNPAYRPATCSTLDLDGNPRVSGSAIDIGAWERDQSSLVFGGYPSEYSSIEQTNITFNATALGGADDLVFRWDYGNGTIEDTREFTHEYHYPTSGLFTVRLKASADGGETWQEWHTISNKIVIAPKTMFVDSNSANPVFPYKTRETAANSLITALSALTNSISESVPCVNGVEIRILKGSRLEETAMRLACGMAIVGDTENPEDVEIVDNVEGNRAFTITHQDAVLKGVTISGDGLRTNGGYGGHISMSAGRVERCIISGGKVGRAGGCGGNVSMSGGKLVSSQILNGRAAYNAHTTPYSYGGGIYASGGIIDSCLVKGNGINYYGSGGGIYLAGGVTVINCTITDNTPATTGDVVTGGIRLASDAAKVVNTVIYGNGNKSGAAEFGTWNLGRFEYCASGVTNSSCATWMVIGDEVFRNYSKRDVDVSYLRPNNSLGPNGKLCHTGTSHTDYIETYGGSATCDVLGVTRAVGARLDLGAIACSRRCLVIQFR